MQASTAIEIRLLGESDIPAAMQLKEAAGWNQTEEDWRRLLMLEPDGCFGAIKDGQLSWYDNYNNIRQRSGLDRNGTR